MEKGFVKMLEVSGKILQIYKEYTGTGMIGALFLTAVFYLLFEERVREKKLILAVLPLVLAAFFACPVFAYLISGYLDEEIYYRFLWLLPVTAVIAYAGVRVVLKVSGIRRIMGLLGICGIIMVCGDYVYDNSYFSKAENPYHVPGTVVKICDEIQVEGREVRAVFPGEMVQYVRQYTPYVCMPYGREMIVERWKIGNEMYELFELGLPDGFVSADKLAETARKYEVHYIIWDSGRFMEGNLESCGFRLLDTIDGYAVYVDEKANLNL